MPRSQHLSPANSGTACRLCSIDRDQTSQTCCHARMPSCIDQLPPPSRRPTRLLSVSMRGDHTRGPHIRSLRSASAVPCPASGRLASSARVHERRQCSGNRRYRLGDGWLRPRTTCTADQPTWLLRCWAHRQTYTAIIFICIHHTCFLKYSSYPVYTYRIYVEQLSWSVRVP